MTVQTLTLTDFLLARIAEDEAVAQSASFLRPSGPDPTYASPLDGLLRMQQRFAPARVLAECAAKRRIVRDHAYLQHGCPVDDGEMAAVSWREPCDTLRTFAGLYADHPDYQSEWRP